MASFNSEVAGNTIASLKFPPEQRDPSLPLDVPDRIVRPDGGHHKVAASGEQGLGRDPRAKQKPKVI